MHLPPTYPDVINILIRSIAFTLIISTAIPRSFQEYRRAEDWLGRVPLILFVFSVLLASFIISSVFFVYLEFVFLDTFDSIILLFMSILWASLYSQYIISEKVREIIRREKDDTDV